MMKMMIATVLATILCFACGDGSDDAKNPELGSATLALVSSTATHTYILSGSLEVWKAGVHQTTVSLSGEQSVVTIPNLTPGNYDLFLVWGGTLLKDGSPVPATLVGSNPFPIVVVAGAATSVPLEFNVAGDPPVGFEPGSIDVSVVVNEIVPDAG